MTRDDDYLRRRTARPDVFPEEPTIGDTRIAVELVLSLLAQGASIEKPLNDSPELEQDDVRVCAVYTHAVIPAIRPIPTP